MLREGWEYLVLKEIIGLKGNKSEYSYFFVNIEGDYLFEDRRGIDWLGVC